MVSALPVSMFECGERVRVQFLASTTYLKENFKKLDSPLIIGQPR